MLDKKFPDSSLAESVRDSRIATVIGNGIRKFISNHKLEKGGSRRKEEQDGVDAVLTASCCTADDTSISGIAKYLGVTYL